MGSRHQPEAGADSEHIHQFSIEHEGTRICECGLVEHPPLMELPRPDLPTIRQHLAAAGVPEDQIESEASKVVMADALGRAIHAARGTKPWPDLCVQFSKRPGIAGSTIGEFKPIPYGSADECTCEAMALELVQLMAAQSVLEATKQSPLVVPGVGKQVQ